MEIGGYLGLELLEGRSVLMVEGSVIGASVEETLTIIGIELLDGLTLVVGSGDDNSLVEEGIVANASWSVRIPTGGKSMLVRLLFEADWILACWDDILTSADFLVSDCLVFLKLRA